MGPEADDLGKHFFGSPMLGEAVVHNRHAQIGHFEISKRQ
jgi:hypothetical protein